jgi:glycerol-3-phosphate dehydrogenase (NAD(P)+)
MNANRVAVIGAGSWGTALANLLAQKGHETCIWSYEPSVAAAIERDHRNPVYLSEIALDERLRATGDLAEALHDAEVVVSASPSQVVRQVMQRAAEQMPQDALIVSASKGIELGTLKLMDEVLAESLPASFRERLAFLSGPSFALEVGQGLPTAVTIAAHREDVATAAQEVFQTPRFRVYTHHDVRGVELGGALKNVVAIAAGAVDGLGLGHNTRAALITRGLAEMTRLGTALGAHPQTFAGLAGMGDLILTCTGALSRNRSVGYALGQGKRLEDVLGGMVMVAEGVKTAESANALAQRTGVEMPIVEAVHALLTGRMTAGQAMESLLLREPKPEQWR